MVGPACTPDRLALVVAAGLAASALVLAALWLGLTGPHGAQPPLAAGARPDAALALDAPVREVPASQRSVGPVSPPASTPARAEREVLTRRPLSPHLRVRVLGTPDQALPGAEVVVYLQPAPASGGFVARRVADAEGACSIDVAPLRGAHPFELDGRAVLVRVSHAGWRPHEWRLKATQLYRPDFELRAVLQPGGALHGRVVDGSGQPLAGASVTLLAPRDDPDGDLSMLARTSSTGDGSFQAGFPPRSARAVLVAAHSSHGAVRRDVTLVGAAPVDLGDLRLEPAGELAGRVVFPDGRPARRAQVLATAIEASRFERALPDATSLPGGRVEADEQGRFRLALLEPGVYRLDVGNPYTVDRTFAQRQPRTFRTPARDVLLQAAHVALCVRVVDRTGHALGGVAVEARRVRADHERPDGEARGQLRLLDKSFAQTSGDPPVAILALDPGDRVVLRATLGACYPAQELVVVDATPGEQPVTLEVFSRAETVRVRPRVLDAAGREAREYAVDVFDPYTRLAVRTGLEPDEDGILPTLAPGPWLLRARSPLAAPHTDGALPDTLGTSLTLRPDGEQRIELRLE